LFLGINAPALFSEGMFMDGLIYSTISRNLAEGKGSFWDLFFSETYNSHFQGHPPLAMGLESLLFYVFGDSLLVERFYSLLTFIVSGFLIIKIWKKLVERELQQLYWLPLLFLTSIGVVGWSMANNMLENTMLVFILLSFFILLKSLSEENVFKLFIYLLLAGFSLFLGFLSKGFVALFPLVSLFYFGVFTKEISFWRGIRDSSIILIGLLLPFVFIFVFIPEGVESLSNYYHVQVEASIKKTIIGNSRYWIIWNMFQQLIPSFVLIIMALYLVGGKKLVSFSKKQKVILAVGLSGVLPILITVKQRDFYIVGAYPFFAIALSMFIAPILKSYLDKITKKKQYLKKIKIFSFVLVLVSLIITTVQFGRIGRDVKLINDVKIIGTEVKQNSILLISPKLAQNWALQGYFARYLSISLTTNRDFDFDYLIKDTVEDEVGFEKVEEVELEQLVLYRKVD